MLFVLVIYTCNGMKLCLQKAIKHTKKKSAWVAAKYYMLIGHGECYHLLLLFVFSLVHKKSPQFLVFHSVHIHWWNKHTDEGIIKHTSVQFVIFLYFEYEWEIDVLHCTIISFEKLGNENRRVPLKPFSQNVLNYICCSDSVCTTRDVAEILQHCWQLAIMSKYYTYGNLPRLP